MNSASGREHRAAIGVGAAAFRVEVAGVRRGFGLGCFGLLVAAVAVADAGRPTAGEGIGAATSGETDAFGVAGLAGHVEFLPQVDDEVCLVKSF